MAMSDQLGPPSMVEVVAAESVEPAMSEVSAELASLEAELRRLQADAEEIEREVDENRPRGDESNSAIPLLEHAFAEQAATVRAELRLALQKALREAKDRLTRAQADAESLLAGGPPLRARSVRPGSTIREETMGSPGRTAIAAADSEIAAHLAYGRNGDYRSVPPERPPAPAPERSFDDLPRRAAPSPPPSLPPRFAPRPPMPDYPRDPERPGPHPVARRAPEEPSGRAPYPEPEVGRTWERRSDQGPASGDPQVDGGMQVARGRTMTAPRVEQEDAVPVPRADDEAAPFGRFWHGEKPPASANARTRPIVDALLVVLAVAILALVILSWIG